MNFNPLWKAARRLLLAVLVPFAASHSQTIEATITRVPTELVFDIETRSGTNVRGLNDNGQYVGTFGERNWTIWGLQHGFIHGSDGFGTGPMTPDGSLGRYGPEGFRLGRIEGVRYLDPAYRYLDFKPENGSSFNDRVTTPMAINNSGVVVGSLSNDYLDRGPHTAFVYDSHSGELRTLNVPGATSSWANGINASGQIVGNFTDADGVSRGFLYSGGTYSVITHSGYPNGSLNTILSGINSAGVIVGSSYDSRYSTSGFIYRNGAFEDFTVQDTYTVAAAINDAEQVVGWIRTPGRASSFLYQAGSSVLLDLTPGAGETFANAINNLGVIGGTVGDVGFLATVSSVPEAASWALWLAGAHILLLRLRGGARPAGAGCSYREHAVMLS